MDLGSAALHYVYVATGAFAAACSAEIRLWDIAAAAAIIYAAGGVMTTHNGTPRFPFDCGSYQGGDVPIIAGGETVVREIAQLMPHAETQSKA